MTCRTVGWEYEKRVGTASSTRYELFMLDGLCTVDLPKDQGWRRDLGISRQAWLGVSIGQARDSYTGKSNTQCSQQSNPRRSSRFFSSTAFQASNSNAPKPIHADHNPADYTKRYVVQNTRPWSTTIHGCHCSSYGSTSSVSLSSTESAPSSSSSSSASFAL